MLFLVIVYCEILKLAKIFFAHSLLVKTLKINHILTFALFTRSAGSFAEAASGAIAVFTQRKIAGVVCKAAACGGLLPPQMYKFAVDCRLGTRSCPWSNHTIVSAQHATAAGRKIF